MGQKRKNSKRASQLSKTKNQGDRFKRILGRLAMTVLVCTGINFMAHQFDPYPSIQVPEGYYKPEMTGSMQLYHQGQFASLPLQSEDSFLKQRLEAKLAEYPAALKPHVFYVNLEDYRYVSIAADDPVPAASVIKLPILMEFFRQVDQGILSPQANLAYEDFEQAAGSGTLQYRSPGIPLPAREVAQMMIQSSDNTCTNMLIYALGGSTHLNQIFEGRGLKGTHIANWLPDLGGSNVISMRDMATVLYNVTYGDILSPSSKEEARKILLGTHNRRLLPALLPKDTLIAHKTGDIGTSLGNSGLIELPNGQKYIIAIQVERPYNDYSARDMIQQVSKVVYDTVKDQNNLASAQTESNTNGTGSP